MPYVTIGAESAKATDGGGPFTVIVPLRLVLIASWYLNVPAAENVCVYVLPGPRIGEANEPSLATT